MTHSNFFGNHRAQHRKRFYEHSLPTSCPTHLTQKRKKRSRQKTYLHQEITSKWHFHINENGKYLALTGLNYDAIPIGYMSYTTEKPGLMATLTLGASTANKPIHCQQSHGTL